MKDADLVYLAHLVRRDGDKDLQSFFGTEPAKLYHELMTIADQANSRRYGREMRIPIMPTMSIFGSDHSLEYRPRILKP